MVAKIVYIDIKFYTIPNNICSEDYKMYYHHSKIFLLGKIGLSSLRQNETIVPIKFCRSV